MTPVLTKFDGDYPLGEWQGQRQSFMGYVKRLSPKRIEIVELLSTKAPNPCIAQPYCCLVDRVIFYVRPYTLRPWSKIYCSRGKYQLDQPPKGMQYEQWDTATHTLRWDSPFVYDGEEYITGGGTVFWANKRWWMRHWARMKEVRE